MALFVKEDKMQKSGGGLGSQPMSASDLTPSGTREAQAHLGRGSRVEGKLSFESSVRIDGQIEGEITAQGTLIIGDGAEVNAKITAHTVIVGGRLNGDVTAQKRIELEPSASVVGNITTPTLVVKEGAAFEGHCTMGGAERRPDRERDQRVAIFPAEERGAAARRSSEAAS